MDKLKILKELIKDKNFKILKNGDIFVKFSPRRKILDKWRKYKGRKTKKRKVCYRGYVFSRCSVIYLKYCGFIPKNHNITFKDGNHDNCSFSNLKLFDCSLYNRTNTCIICGNKIKWRGYKSDLAKRYCSRSCANIRKHSKETKNKIAKSLIRTKQLFPQKRKKGYHINKGFKCKGCSRLVYRKNKKYCSAECYFKNFVSPKKAGKGLKGRYQGIWCDSSWELAWIVYHLEHGYSFKRNSTHFSYKYNNKLKYWIPDFKFKNGRYNEIKGYIKDKKQLRARLSYFPFPIKVLYKKDIKQYLKYTIDKYGKNFTKKLYSK